MVSWLVGVIIIGYGVYELYSGIKEKFMSEFKTYEMNGMERNVARIAGKIGLISRGIVIGIMGFFFTHSGLPIIQMNLKDLVVL